MCDHRGAIERGSYFCELSSLLCLRFPVRNVACYLSGSFILCFSNCVLVITCVTYYRTDVIVCVNLSFNYITSW